MPNQILIDSDAFYALINPRDSNHHQALFINKTLINKKTFFTTTNLVIYEVANLLSYLLTQQTAIKFLNDILDSHIEILTISNDLEKETLKIFTSQTKNKTSIVDCANIAVMKKLGLNTIFAFDRRYKQNGLKRVGID